MNVGVLGTGIVGQTLATKLVELGHDVVMGSREATNTKGAEWVESVENHGRSATFADAASHGVLVVNATSGGASLAAMDLAGSENLAGKVLVDVANPLDFSQGMPPSLTVANTDSLGEQIQRALPSTLVVKALNTVNASLMVSPQQLSLATNLFVAGNDADAKSTVARLLESFGWVPSAIVDLGDITAARGMEAYLLLWVRIMQTIGTAAFNVHLVSA